MTLWLHTATFMLCGMYAMPCYGVSVLFPHGNSFRVCVLPAQMGTAEWDYADVEGALFALAEWPAATRPEKYTCARHTQC
eukprot:COSAG05_NODE_548_length_8749_cov_33.055838_7_plen_80_part_00